MAEASPTIIDALTRVVDAFLSGHVEEAIRRLEILIGDSPDWLATLQFACRTKDLRGVESLFDLEGQSWSELAAFIQRHRWALESIVDTAIELRTGRKDRWTAVIATPVVWEGREIPLLNIRVRTNLGKTLEFQEDLDDVIENAGIMIAGVYRAWSAWSASEDDELFRRSIAMLERMRSMIGTMLREEGKRS